MNQNILDTIAARTKERIREEKKRIPLSEIRREAETLMRCDNRPVAQGTSIGTLDSTSTCMGFRFKKALSAPGISFICEVKKASPSKGMIAEHFPYLAIAQEYAEAGAAAISCLTEPYWFLGKDRYLKEIAASVPIPILRKDFTVDEYMIYQAKALGASAVLLICAILDDGQLRSYRELAESLGLDALVEAHTEEEVLRASKAGASIIGINNRNLKTFEVDMNVSRTLRTLVPKETLFVSESGIRTAEDIAVLYENGTDAVLIGETLMRAADKKEMLRELCSLIGDREGSARQTSCI